MIALILLVVAIPKVFGRTARIRRRVRAAPQCAIRELGEAAPAPTRIAGMVVPVDEPLIAPLSGRPCVYYETRVVRMVGLGMEEWDIEYQVAAEQRSVQFLVDDGTGRALVDVTHSQVLLGEDVERSASEGGDDAAAEDAFLARFGQRRRGLLFAKRLYFSESVIEVGERIAVVGSALSDQGSSERLASPYRHNATTTCPRLAGSRRSPLLVTDDPTLAPPLVEE